MRAAKNTQESKFMLETEKGYIYKSVTSYDRLNDNVQYVVDNKKADFGDRFDSLENALNFYNEVF